MKPIESVDRAAFRWLRDTGGKEAFQLLSGDDEVTRLEWTTAYGSRATAETSSGVWTVKRNGFLSPHVTLRDSVGKDLARLDVHFTSSRLILPQGATYTLRRRGILIPAWSIGDAVGRPLMHIEAVSQHGRLTGGVVAVEAPARSNSDLLILLLVGWYYIVQAWFEEEAGATAVAAIVATG